MKERMTRSEMLEAKTEYLTALIRVREFEMSAAPENVRIHDLALILHFVRIDVHQICFV